MKNIEWTKKQHETKPYPKKHTFLKRIGLGVGIIGLALAIGIGVTWHNEIGTIWSMKEIMPENAEHKDGAVYEIKVQGDYYFDKFLTQGGASKDTDLIDFITQNVTKGLFQVNIAESKISCSSFTAQTEAGARLFGRNYDMHQTHLALVHTQAGRGRYESVSTIDLGFLGIKGDRNLDNDLMNKVKALAAPYIPLDGMNEKGLGVGIYMTYQGPDQATNQKDVATDQNTDKPDLTSSTFLRLLLDQCATVDEAIALAEKYDMHDSAGSSFHYMVADASGQSAVLEWVGESDSTDIDGSKRRMVVNRNTDPQSLTRSKEYQVVTNFVLTPGYYTQGGKLYGEDRFEKMQEFLRPTEGKVKDEEAAMKILESVGRRNWKNDDANTTTTHSVIYDLTNKSIYWVGNEHFDNDEYTYHYQFDQSGKP